jgi:hypothetical protein
MQTERLFESDYENPRHPASLSDYKVIKSFIRPNSLIEGLPQTLRTLEDLSPFLEACISTNYDHNRHLLGRVKRGEMASANHKLVVTIGGAPGAGKSEALSLIEGKTNDEIAQKTRQMSIYISKYEEAKATKILLTKTIVIANPNQLTPNDQMSVINRSQKLEAADAFEAAEILIMMIPTGTYLIIGENPYGIDPMKVVEQPLGEDFFTDFVHRKRPFHVLNKGTVTHELSIGIIPSPFVDIVLSRFYRPMLMATQSSEEANDLQNDFLREPIFRQSQLEEIQEGAPLAHLDQLEISERKIVWSLLRTGYLDNKIPKEMISIIENNARAFLSPEDYPRSLRDKNIIMRANSAMVNQAEEVISFIVDKCDERYEYWLARVLESIAYREAQVYVLIFNMELGNPADLQALVGIIARNSPDINFYKPNRDRIKNRIRNASKEGIVHI